MSIERITKGIDRGGYKASQGDTVEYGETHIEAITKLLATVFV